MDELLGFLQTIVAEPDDYTHRLVFADWLEDAGRSAWADLIRTQCALARLLVGEERPFELPWFLEVMQVRPELHEGLLAPFAPLVPLLTRNAVAPEGPLLSAFQFWVRRGFVEGLQIHGGLTTVQFIKQAESILQRIPLRHLRILSATSRAATQSYPYWEHGSHLHDLTLRRLLKLDFAPRLLTLDLASVRPTEDHARCLLENRHRLSLRLLRVAWYDEQVTQELRAAFGEALDVEGQIPF